MRDKEKNLERERLGSGLPGRVGADNLEGKTVEELRKEEPRKTRKKQNRPWRKNGSGECWGPDASEHAKELRRARDRRYYLNKKHREAQKSGKVYVPREGLRARDLRKIKELEEKINFLQAKCKKEESMRKPEKQGRKEKKGEKRKREKSVNRFRTEEEQEGIDRPETPPRYLEWRGMREGKQKRKRVKNNPGLRDQDGEKQEVHSGMTVEEEAAEEDEMVKALEEAFDAPTSPESEQSEKKGGLRKKRKRRKVEEESEMGETIKNRMETHYGTDLRRGLDDVPDLRRGQDDDSDLRRGQEDVPDLRRGPEDVPDLRRGPEDVPDLRRGQEDVPDSEERTKGCSRSKERTR
eukprot:sb/3466209/